MRSCILIPTKNLSQLTGLAKQQGGLLKWLNRGDKNCLSSELCIPNRTYYNKHDPDERLALTRKLDASKLSRKLAWRVTKWEQNSNSSVKDFSRSMSTNSKDDGPNDEEMRLRAKFEPHEIKFKNPHGHVACLEWGQREAPNKILCVHGWLDNAGSFERLIPFILNHEDNSELYHVIAMDMPGVGHSSHRPVGTDYTTWCNIIEMRRVTTQLGWTNGVTLLSHSLGAHFSFLYACIYPKQVDSFISIDVERPITFQATNWNVTIANAIENHFKCENHHESDPNSTEVVPVYSESEALKRLMVAHSSSLTRESARVLMKRGARKFNQGYTFNRDIRHRHLAVEFKPDDDLMMKYLDQSFSANLLVIRSTKSPFRRPTESRIKYYEIFQRNCSIFRDRVIDGTHHLHMNNPDTVAKEINLFLDDVKKAKLKMGTSVDCEGIGGKSSPKVKSNL